MTHATSISEWAREELFSARLPDRRNTQRAMKMLVRLGERPAGRVLDVFETSAERQGSYDFLENSAISGEALSESFAEAALMRAPREEVFVALDGTSLALTDLHEGKDFGAIGTSRTSARGLKVINALAVSARGVPLGVTAQVWWARKPLKRRQDHQTRSLEDKETRHWITAIERNCKVAARLDCGTRLCFLVDREGDGAHVLSALVASGHDFIVRSSHNRRLAEGIDRERHIWNALRRTRVVGEYTCAVTAGTARSAREARMVVRYRDVVLRLRDKATGQSWPLKVTAASAREVGTVPRGEKPLNWMLLTNRTVTTCAHACAVVHGYTHRWRIEDFHRTWKSGDCNVEDTQLRRMDHVIKWATLMATTAARIERMKLLSRTDPDQPASMHFSPYEIQALVLNRRRTKKRTDPEPTDTPTLGEAVRWLADFGGYTGKSSGGPPGSVTIARGFERIVPIALVLEQLERDGRLR